MLIFASLPTISKSHMTERGDYHAYMFPLWVQVSSKITRDEVERMLRKVQQTIPQNHAPASGTRLKCIRQALWVLPDYGKPSRAGC